MEKKAVVAATFHWQAHLHIGSHQYAKQLAWSGYRVAYISEPISPLHFIFAQDRSVLREKFRTWIKGGEWVEGGRIWAYVPMTLSPGYDKPYLRSSLLLKNKFRFTFPPLRAMLRKNGFSDPEILFLDEPYPHFYNILSFKKKVFRIHDELDSLGEKGNQILGNQARETIHKSDVVVVVSRLLERFAHRMGAKKVLYLPSGADLKDTMEGSSDFPEEYRSIPSPRVVYVGTISSWLDLELMRFAALKLPDVSFVLIGKPQRDLSGLATFPNLYVLGRREHSLISRYLKNADVGIIPYKAGLSRVLHIHPIKLYEYLACGLPVVSTMWPEMKNLDSPALLASNHEDFIRLLRQALTHRDSEKYREYARANSWKSRTDLLLKTLSGDSSERKL